MLLLEGRGPSKKGVTVTKYQIEAHGKVTTYATLDDAKAAADVIYNNTGAIAGIFASKAFDLTHLGDFPADL